MPRRRRVPSRWITRAAPRWPFRRRDGSARTARRPSGLPGNRAAGGASVRSSKDPHIFLHRLFPADDPPRICPDLAARPALTAHRTRPAPAPAKPAPAPRTGWAGRRRTAGWRRCRPVSTEHRQTTRLEARTHPAATDPPAAHRADAGTGWRPAPAPRPPVSSPPRRAGRADGSLPTGPTWSGRWR